jgi:hypothetical protein
MITDGLNMLSNASFCINDNGYGYSSEGESQKQSFPTAKYLQYHSLLFPGPGRYEMHTASYR